MKGGDKIVNEHHSIESMLMFLIQNQKENNDKIDTIKEKVKTIKLKQDKIILRLKEIKKMASQGFELMEAKIMELKEVDDSILTLITTLTDNIAKATTLEEAQQIATEIDTEKNRLLSAIKTPGPVA